MVVERDMVAEVLLKKKGGYHKIDRCGREKYHRRGDEGRGVYILDPLSSFLLFNIIEPDELLLTLTMGSLFLVPFGRLHSIAGFVPRGFGTIRR